MENATNASEALLRLNSALFLPVGDGSERKDCGEDEGKVDDIVPPRVGTPDFKPEIQLEEQIGPNVMLAFPFVFPWMQDKCTCNCSRA